MLHCAFGIALPVVIACCDSASVNASGSHTAMWCGHAFLNTPQSTIAQLS